MPFDYSKIDTESILKRLYDQMSPLQRPAVGKARYSGRCIFNMWMGTGKTLSGLASGLCFKPQVWLIICTKKARVGWRNEVKKWIPELGDEELFQVIGGTAAERKRQYQNPQALFFATTAAAFIRDIKWLRDSKVRFDVITIDELHKIGLRNRKSEGFKAIKLLVTLIEKNFKVKLINPMTGTWTSKGNPQMWPTLNLLAPKEFKSYWQFVHSYNIVVQGPFGKVIGGPQNVHAFAQVTSPYVYTVTEEQAKEFLPPLQRLVLPVKLDAKQRLAYDQMEKHMFIDVEESGELYTVETILAKMMRLRQLLCCPAIIDENLGVGNVIEYVVDQIKEFDEYDHWKHNIIFTPFVPALKIWKPYLSQELKIPESDILIVQGGMEDDDLDRVEKTFRKNRETMILASLMSSASWNAETAFNAYFPHFSWDQDDNKQAEGRARRTDGKQQLIRAYYAAVENTITGDMFDTINGKEYTNKITLKYLQQFQEKMRDRHQKLQN